MTTSAEFKPPETHELIRFLKSAFIPVEFQELLREQPRFEPVLSGLRSDQDESTFFYVAVGLLRENQLLDSLLVETLCAARPRRTKEILQLFSLRPSASFGEDDKQGAVRVVINAEEDLPPEDMTRILDLIQHLSVKARLSLKKVAG